MKTNCQPTLAALTPASQPFSGTFGRLRTGRPLIGLILSIIACAFIATSASAVDVVLKVVDQHGQEIPGSRISVLSQNVNTGASVSLPEGAQFFLLMPGLRGATGNTTELYRTDAAEVTAATTELVFEWITSSYTVRIRDQYGVDIPASKFQAPGPPTPLQPGDPVVLPITDESVYPALNGGYKDGYYATLIPGLRGAAGSTTELYRYAEGPLELSLAPEEFVFEWITSTYTVRIRDQYGVDIPASQFQAPGPSTPLQPGDPVVLPITDESVYPALNGGYKEGYYATLIPGLRGAPGSTTELYRYAEGPLELSLAPEEFVFEWITSTYTVRLKDQHGVNIPGSTFTAPYEVFNSGDSITLPITDETVYPAMAGFYKDGYYTALAPGINGSPARDFLSRYESGLELSTEPAAFDYEWIQHTCTLEVRNAANSLVPGSDVVLPSYFPDYAPDQAVTIPVNDVATYPLIGGYYASNNLGYWIGITAGDIAPSSDTIYFTLSASGVFSPGPFAIGGNTYSLALGDCGDCCGCEPPDIVSLTAPAEPLALGSAAIVMAQFADSDRESGRLCAFDWGDGTSDAGIDASAVLCSASHTYTLPGVYRVTVTASNECGDTDAAVHEFIVVYDPEGGFVTGGGWIWSPEGAFHPELEEFAGVTGKANFGFVSKYKNGATVPTGQTEFQFKAGDLNFKSTSYDWLVVAGAKSKYKGRGTINGAGDYGFQITATDGQVNGGGGTDRFRIKIRETASGEVIYDNQPGAPDDADATTALGGGSIVIHKP